MTPSQETSPEPFPHEERAMDRLLAALGVRAPAPREAQSRRQSRGGLAGRLAAALLAVVFAAGFASLGETAGVAAGSAPAGACASGSTVRHVALVIQHGDGRTLSRCVRFSGTTMTGEQVLQASGIEYQVQNFGTLGDAVCQIDHEPASYSQCLPSSGSYWALFTSPHGGAWQGASKGISELKYLPGDGVGLRYDPESASTAAPPSIAAPASCTAALGCGAVRGTKTGDTSAGSGVSPALIASLAVAALLVVLLLLQVSLRRRRTTSPRE